MGDNPRHPSRTKRSWSSVGEPGRDVRGTGYHPGKKGRRDSGSFSRRSGQVEYGERFASSRRPSREYSALALEQRSDPYSPKVPRVQPRYQSPLKPSPRLHDPSEKECASRLVPDLRHQAPTRDHSIYPRHHGAQPWSGVGPPTEIRRAEQQDDGHHTSQQSRQMLAPDAQTARSFPGDPLLPASSRNFSSIRSAPVNGEERSAVKLEPRGLVIGRQSTFKADVEDVKLEPRTRTTDESDRGGDTGPPGRKKRLGFGDSVYKRQQQYGVSIGTTSPKLPDAPVEPASSTAPANEDRSPEKQLKVTFSDLKESSERAEPAAAVKNDPPKDTVPMSMAESIVVKMNKLDDEIRELDQKILDTERLHEKVGQEANDLAAKVEMVSQEHNGCPEADAASCLESENGDSQSNFVIMSPSGGSQSGEIDATGKLGPVEDEGGLIEQSQPNGPSSFPPVSASKTLSVRSCSDQDVSTSSRGDCGEQVPNMAGVVPSNGDVFGDRRLAQVLEDNIVTAQASYDEVWKGLTMIPEETILQQSRQELEIQWDGSRVLPLLRTIQKWKREQASREKELAYQYADLLENFQIKLDEGKADEMVADTTDGLIRKPSRTCRGARSDYGEFKLVQELIGREDLMTMVKMPDRIMYPWQGRMWINRNRLVKDAAADLQANLNRSPWTDEEKKIFMDKFIEHPKDFRTIATFLDKRKTSECIELYYRIQKLDEFAFVRRKQQLKKRRQLAETKKTMICPHLMLSPSEKALRYPTVTPSSRSRIRGPTSLNSIPYAGQLRHKGTGQTSFSRYQSDDFPWSDEEFMDAIRCHRTDIRAIAEQFGCRVQLVGTFVLDNRRRLGLDGIFADRDRDSDKRELPPTKDDSLTVEESRATYNWAHHDAKNEPINLSKPIEVFDKSMDVFASGGPRVGFTLQSQIVKPEDNTGLGLDSLREQSTLGDEENRLGQSPWVLPIRDSSDNLSHLSLFTKQGYDVNPALNSHIQSDHVDMAGPQALPSMHAQMYQTPLNALSPTSSLPFGHIDNPLIAAAAAAAAAVAGVQSNVALASFLTPEMSALLAQGMQPLTQQHTPLQSGPRNMSDASSSIPVAEVATDPSGSVGKAYPGISSSTGVPYPVPDEQVTLRPSLLSGSGEVFTPQPYTHEEMMMNDGLEPQHAPAGREETQASSELPGGLNSDASVMSVLLNLLRALHMGAPAIQPDTQINSFLATALQLLYGAGSPLLIQPPAHQPIPSEAPQPPITPSQAFHPLFLSPQAGSPSMPYPQTNPSLDGLGYLQGIATQHVGGPPTTGSSQMGSQESLRQMYGTRLVQLLLAGMVQMHPHMHAALQASQAVNQPDRLLYQQQGGLNANHPLLIPEIPVSTPLAQVVDAAAVPGLGLNPNCGERIWIDAPTLSRDASSTGVGSPRKPPATEGSEAARM